jgi:hypothetical protein
MSNMMMTMRGVMADTADVTTHLQSLQNPANQAVCRAMPCVQTNSTMHIMLQANKICTCLDNGDGCTVASSAHDAVNLLKECVLPITRNKQTRAREATHNKICSSSPLPAHLCNPAG